MTKSITDRTKVTAFFAGLFLVDSYLYFRHIGHFFQADSLFLLDNRAKSILDFLGAFITRNPSGFYRPLAFTPLESIFYPFFGLNPTAYRIPVYAVFMLVTIAVFAITLAITRRHLAAAIAAMFFNFHMVNAYATYDIAFMPELLYALFYIGAVLAYLRYVRDGSTWAMSVSIGAFAAGLLSKEAALTLPAVLIALYILVSPFESVGKTLVGTLRSVWPHILLLFGYLIFAFGYLHVMGFSLTSLPDASRAPDGSYVFAAGSAILTNADVALTWAFNIPRGWWGQWQQPSPAALAFLKTFRVITIALMLILLTGAGRRVVAFGAAWFFITVFPALPLLNHFIPYYLFLPVAGLSMIVGTGFAWAYDNLRRLHPGVAATFLALMAGGVFLAVNPGITADIKLNRLLGGSAELALNSLNDLKRLYPALPPNQTIYVDDVTEPLYWDHNGGGLFRMAYSRNDIAVQYASRGAALFEGQTANLIVIGVRDKHLIDKTSEYLGDPKRFVHFEGSDRYSLGVSTNEVIPGGKFTLTISGLNNEVVTIAYKVSDGPFETYQTKLNAGQSTFDVSAESRKGTYWLAGFNIPGSREWIWADKTITVR